MPLYVGYEKAVMGLDDSRWFVKLSTGETPLDFAHLAKDSDKS